MRYLGEYARRLDFVVRRDGEVPRDREEVLDDLGERYEGKECAGPLLDDQGVVVVSVGAFLDGLSLRTDWFSSITWPRTHMNEES